MNDKLYPGLSLFGVFLAFTGCSPAEHPSSDTQAIASLRQDYHDAMVKIGKLEEALAASTLITNDSSIVGDWAIHSVFYGKSDGQIHSIPTGDKYLTSIKYFFSPARDKLLKFSSDRHGNLRLQVYELDDITGLPVGMKSMPFTQLIFQDEDNVVTRRGRLNKNPGFMSVDGTATVYGLSQSIEKTVRDALSKNNPKFTLVLLSPDSGYPPTTFRFEISDCAGYRAAVEKAFSMAKRNPVPDFIKEKIAKQERPVSWSITPIEELYPVSHGDKAIVADTFFKSELNDNYLSLIVHFDGSIEAELRDSTFSPVDDLLDGYINVSPAIGDKRHRIPLRIGRRKWRTKEIQRKFIDLGAKNPVVKCIFDSLTGEKPITFQVESSNDEFPLSEFTFTGVVFKGYLSAIESHRAGGSTAEQTSNKGSEIDIRDTPWFKARYGTGRF